MALKDLLVLTGTGMEAAGTYALSLSTTCGACLTAAVPTIEPSLPPGLAAELPDDLLSRMKEEVEVAASRAVEQFAQVAREADKSIDIVRFRAIAGEVGYSLSQVARCFDAVILPQPNPDGTDTSDIIEACLFGSGRPIVIVPYIRIRPDIDSILIAWDGGQPAARAVADALPLLSLAHHVEIVTIGKGENGNSHLSGRILARHLARHRIQAEAKRLPIDEVDVANMLLSHAADMNADLIVMGGYGHSRLREVVLGGTTREVLRSVTVPVLMSH
ncbi:universal stress protein [Microvirga mediterraneensis]|uniref:Universal stress protein n=1 Tax=Microvirga mediterraneensis TaxID=2754695 RepID=A0A838BUS5_9HYPH|nr:universal stress protein [Microvirga mediterraneensis]MBA1158799.1 universal stress protein [Microvirga mediterraneensis]